MLPCQCGLGTSSNTFPADQKILSHPNMYIGSDIILFILNQGQQGRIVHMSGILGKEEDDFFY